MLKIHGIAKMVAGILKNKYRPKAAADLIEQGLQIPSSAWKDVASISAVSKPRMTQLGGSLRTHGAFDADINQIYLSSFQPPGAKTLRHEMAHAKQFNEPIDYTVDLGTLSSPSPATPLGRIDHFATTPRFGRSVPYLHKPLEIHARAVEQSKKHFATAYKNATEAITQDPIVIEHMDNIITSLREIRSLQWEGNKRMSDQYHAILRTNVSWLRRYLPNLTDKVREAVEKGLISLTAAGLLTQEDEDEGNLLRSATEILRSDKRGSNKRQ